MVRDLFRLGRGNRQTSDRRRLSFERLEERLAMTWVGAPPINIAVPGDTVAVTLKATNDAKGSGKITAGEVDYYAFTAKLSGTYVFSAQTPKGNLNPFIGVFSSSGQLLTYNDDMTPGINADSAVAINLTAGERYCFGITNNSAATLGSYKWYVDGPAWVDDAYENNDKRTQAYNLGAPTSTQTTNSLVMADKQDWFQFSTLYMGTSGSSVSVNFQNSLGNLQLGLYNSSGKLVATSAGTGDTESISLDGRPAGTYYVKVYGERGTFNQSYSLTITPPTAPPAPPAPPDPPAPPAGAFQITLTMTGLTAGQQAIFQQAADRWEQIIVGDLPNVTYLGQAVDDVWIEASAVAIDGAYGILGEAGPDVVRSSSYLPVHGIMEFDSADMARMEQNGSLFKVVVHEMAHVLGIGTLWQAFGLLSGTSTSNPVYIGANATAAYNQIFGLNSSSVPVENTGGPGTALGHWRESVFTNEVMTGWVNSGSMPISRVTVGSLADMGYQVNYAAADVFTPGSSAISLAAAASTGSSSYYGLMSAEGAQIAVSQPAKPAVKIFKTQWQWPLPAVLPRTNRHVDAANVDEIMESDWDSTDPEFTLLPEESEWVDEIAADALLAEAL